MRQYTVSASDVYRDRDFTEEHKGYIKYLIAEYYNFVDKVESKKILKVASQFNKKYGTFNGYFTEKQDLQYIDNQVNRILAKFDLKNKYINSCKKVCKDLSYSKSFNQFEGIIHDLGIILGFESERLDNKKEKIKGGPDNLWINDINKAYVIECKNEVEDNSEISKSDASQLNNSDIWVKQNKKIYTTVPIMFHKTNKLSEYATLNKGSRIVTIDLLKQIIDNLKKYIAELEEDGKININSETVKNLLNKYSFDVREFINKYTVEPEN